VSWERISAELQKMLTHRHRRRAMRLADQVGLLRLILPELAPLLDADDDPEWAHTLNILDRLETSRFEPAAAVLLRTLATSSRGKRGSADAGSVGAVCRRLKLSNEQREEIVWLVANQSALAGAEHMATSRLKRLLANQRSRELLSIAHAIDAADHVETPSVRYVAEYLQRTPVDEIDPPPLVTGADLIQLGMRPGPKFKELLERARDAQLEGALQDRETALRQLEEWIAGQSG
ncbi:MAG: hypothetical protein KDA75_05735, partial [Planctomycetaceae bacterium]|nr:hypothetical protein [Planctomycetaceae bacterium]